MVCFANVENKNCKCYYYRMAKDFKLRIPKISFDSPITSTIFDLEELRYTNFSVFQSNRIFFELKNIFHMLESIGSSRIEGNNTTIMDYVESTKFEPPSSDFVIDDIREIVNIENATEYIEENIDNLHVSMKLIRELHYLTVKELDYRKEGAVHPGDFRRGNVKISGAAHVPPDYTQIADYLHELIDFINKDTPKQYDLLKIAIAHHRFVWIHPFENGNGRVVRLFTYVLLLKNIFTSKERIINPTAVFCSNRDNYYKYLNLADSGTDEGLLAWCEYVLSGLTKEIRKIDKLADYNYLKTEILHPALSDAKTKLYVTPIEYNILKRVIEAPQQIIQAKDLSDIFKNKTPSDISRSIRTLLDKKMLVPEKANSRKYFISFKDSFLLRSILRILDEKGFLPLKD